MASSPTPPTAEIESTSARKPAHAGAVEARYCLWCAFVTLAVLALTCPVAECGVNDDWSYSKTALDLAETGHLHYNGWAAAMLGAQAYWGALFIKLFGFSFLVLRFSTALLAAGCGVLAYLLHRKAGLPEWLSVFGALTLTLSPVFVPNAVTFMTDIPGLFLFLASVYGYTRLADVLDPGEGAGEGPASPGKFWGWLGFAFATGLLGGTIRQINWIVPIAAPGYLWWTRRPRAKHQAIPLRLSSLAAFAGAVLLSAWFNAQPYSIQEHVAAGFRRAFQWRAVPYLMDYAARMALTLGAITLPVLAVIPFMIPAWIRKKCRPWGAAIGVVLLTAALEVLTLLLFEHEWVFPWLGNIFRQFHYMDGGAPIPADPAPVFPIPFWKAFSLLVMGLSYGCFLLKFATLDWGSLKQRFTIPEPLGLLVVFALGYVPILLLKTLVPNSFGVFDRYLLPLVPLLTLALLKMFHQETGRDRVPLVGWLVLVGFAFYGAAGAHDYFAQLRARLDLTGELLKRGVPRTRIMAGVEYDAWTQITVAGFYNDSRVKLPPGTVLQTAAPLPFHTAYCLWPLTPVVRPGYVVALGHHPDLFDTDLPAATFDCWLPPFQRALIVQTPEPNLAAVRSLPTRKDP